MRDRVGAAHRGGGGRRLRSPVAISDGEQRDRRGARGEMNLGFPPPAAVSAFCSREERGGPSDLERTARIETLTRGQMGRKLKAVGWAARITESYLSVLLCYFLYQKHIFSCFCLFFRQISYSFLFY